MPHSFKPLFLAVTTLLVLLTGLPNPTYGQVTNWTAIDGNWNDAANWDNGVPGATNLAMLPAVGPGLITVNSPNVLTNAMVMSSGELLLESNLTVDNTFIWNAGTFSGPASLILNTFGETSSNSVNLNSAVTNFGEMFITQATISGNAATWTNEAGANLVFSGGALDGTGVLNNQLGAVTSISASAPAISWDIENQGLFQLANGVLPLVFGNFNQTATGELNLSGATIDFFAGVALDGTVSGTGSILPGGAELVLPGTVSPGNSLGTLQFGGQTTFTSMTLLDFEIGASSDLIDVIGGDITLDGTLDVTALSGFGVGTYTLLTYNNQLIDNGLQLGQIPDGFSLEIVHDMGNDAVLLVVTAVPEPGSTGLLMSFLVVCTFRINRRSTKNEPVEMG